MNSASVGRGGVLRSVNCDSTPKGLLNRISMTRLAHALERTEAAIRLRRLVEQGPRRRPGSFDDSVLFAVLLGNLVAARLDELQGHAVGFADREVLVLVLFLQRQRRRQR